MTVTSSNGTGMVKIYCLWVAGKFEIIFCLICYILNLVSLFRKLIQIIDFFLKWRNKVFNFALHEDQWCHNQAIRKSYHLNNREIKGLRNNIQTPILTYPAFTLGPVCRDFPRQSHSVDARRDFSRWSHQTCWVRGRKSDLGLVIDIAQLFSSNVRMRELWWLGDLTHSRFAQQKPLSRDCPRKAGAFDDCVDGRS